jgi:hypothetical protein
MILCFTGVLLYSIGMYSVLLVFPVSLLYCVDFPLYSNVLLWVTSVLLWFTVFVVFCWYCNVFLCVLLCSLMFTGFTVVYCILLVFYCSLLVFC